MSLRIYSASVTTRSCSLKPTSSASVNKQCWPVLSLCFPTALFGLCGTSPSPRCLRPGHRRLRVLSIPLKWARIQHCSGRGCCKGEYSAVNLDSVSQLVHLVRQLVRAGPYDDTRGVYGSELHLHTRSECRAILGSRAQKCDAEFSRCWY
ncbi:hypothetical protein BJ741DRAFT_39743 [Chytriomyces cf. hyalinus JEL632]|nr:hypothetical protein BJ741DRAFT_39743 [Chytriomyces cf. hyalinus JEL632]